MTNTTTNCTCYDDIAAKACAACRYARFDFTLHCHGWPDAVVARRFDAFVAGDCDVINLSGERVGTLDQWVHNGVQLYEFWHAATGESHCWTDSSSAVVWMPSAQEGGRVAALAFINDIANEEN